MKTNIRVFRNLALLGFLIMWATTVSIAGDKDVFPFSINQIKLPNGLQILAVPFDSPGVIAFLTVVRTGSRNEIEPGCSGFAHFFEHIMFKGTKKFPGPARDMELMLVGAESNAFTSEDFTCYHVVGPKSSLEKIMEIEADRFLNLTYTEDDLKTEATVILGEYQKSSSSPYTILEEKLRDLAFTKHTYKHTVIGFLDDIKNMPNQYEYSLRFHARGYGSEDCAVLVVGDVDPANLEKLARKFYGSWKPGKAQPAPAPDPEPPQVEGKSAHVDWKNETLPIVYFGYHVPAFSDLNPDGPALDVLSKLVFSQISPLYKKLVLDEQKVESIGADPCLYRDAYLFTIIARVKDARDLDYVRQVILDSLNDATRVLFPREELAAVKSACRYGFAMGLDSPQGAAFALAGYLSLTGDPRSINRYYRNLDLVSPLDILRVARRYFNPGNRTIVTLTHEGAKW